jgi:PilZ domain-containing protein
MTLESVLVSRDWQEISVLECILSSLHISVQVESDPERACAKLSKSKVDAVIIDRDLGGTEELAVSLCSSQSTGSSVPLLLLSGSPGRHDLPPTGTTFFFEKPISVEQAVRTLSAARNMMLTGRLRYYRQTVEVPGSLSFPSGPKFSVQLTNVSRGGIGVRTRRSVDISGPIKVRFSLPGMKGPFQAMAELAWRDDKGNAGIRFLEIPEPQERRMQLWLEKQYFAD